MNRIQLLSAYSSMACIILCLSFFVPAALAERSQGWWDHANSQAQRDGYKVITTSELRELYQEGRDFVILDNRFEYELSEGSLPGARNISFDLSELQGLSDEKRAELLEALGPDKDRIVVTYCRDFR